jgi:hypothetical protein
MRAVYMCLVHDMGEAIIGDITPSDGVARGSIFDILNGYVSRPNLRIHRCEVFTGAHGDEVPGLCRSFFLS